MPSTTGKRAAADRPPSPKAPGWGREAAHARRGRPEPAQRRVHTWLARPSRLVRPATRSSVVRSHAPWPGQEYARGWGVFALPFDSGHVLALRGFPANDFGPYRAVAPATAGPDPGAPGQHVGMGRLQMTGIMPSGHTGTLMPERMDFIDDSQATLDGADLGLASPPAGQPRDRRDPLPARGVLATGRRSLPSSTRQNTGALGPRQLVPARFQARFSGAGHREAHQPQTGRIKPCRRHTLA